MYCMSMASWRGTYIRHGDFVAFDFINRMQLNLLPLKILRPYRGKTVHEEFHL